MVKGKDVKGKGVMLAQLIARSVIFVLFLLSIFVVVPAIRYLFILFIIVNLVLGFVNGRRNIITNVVFVILAPSLFVPIWEYLITVILVVISGVHLLRFYLWYRKGGVVEVKKKKGSHGLGFKIVISIIVGVVVLLLLLVLLALFSFSSSGVR